MVGLRNQFHKEFLLLPDRDLLVLVAKETHNEDIRRLHADVKASGAVCHNAAGLVPDGNERSRNRGFGLVKDNAFHGAALAVGGRCRGKSCHKDRHRREKGSD